MKKIYLFLLCLGFSVTSNAQFFKKLKSKITEKINHKIDQETDKQLGTIFSKKKDSNNKNKELPKVASSNTVGTCNIEHNNSLGKVTIQNLGKFKVTVSKHKLEISAAWVTHGVDVFDGFYLEIKDPNANGKNLSFYQNQTYQLYADENNNHTLGASISLGYNPEINNNPKAPYQNYRIQGALTISKLTEKELFITFSGTPTTSYTASPSMATSVKANFSVENFLVTYAEEYAIAAPNNNSSNRSESESNTVPEIYNHSSVPNLSNKKYRFKTQLVYQIQANNNTFLYEVWQGQEDVYAISISQKHGSTIIIYDKDQQLTLVENNGQKLILPSIASNYKNATLNALTSTTETQGFTKTGKEKKILTYQCSEYVYQNNNEKTSIWVSKEFPYQQAFLKFKDGFVLESTIQSKGQTNHIKMVEVKNNPKNVSISEYKNMEHSY